MNTSSGKSKLVALWIIGAAYRRAALLVGRSYRVRLSSTSTSALYES